MKILIIAIARSGSTSFMKKLAEENNLTPIFEPFNFRHDDKNLYNSSMNDVVIKSLVGQYPNSPKVLDLKSLKEWEDWAVEFTKEFDKVILLSRRDLNAAAESFSVASFYNKSWSRPYKYEKLPNLEQSKKYIYYNSRFLNNVSIRLGQPIVYYEDIFDENSKDRLRKNNSEELPKIEVKSLL